MLIALDPTDRLLYAPAGVFRFSIPLVKKSEAQTLGPNEKWITVHPHGEGEKGVPVIIREHDDGTASVIGGAGGKLNFLKLGKLRTKEEWKRSARERAAERKRKEADRVSAQSDEERATEANETEQAKTYHQSKTHSNALETIAALESAGIEHGLTEEHKQALANPPEAGADPEAVKQWKTLTREAGKKAREIQRSYEHKLVTDHEARRSALAGEMPNNLTEGQTHTAADAEGETIAHLQQLPNGQWLATGPEGGKVFDRWDDAAKQHVRNVQAAEQDLGYSTQTSEFYEPNQWVRAGDDEIPFDPSIALEVARLSKERKENARNEKAAMEAIKRGESWQALGEGQAVEPIRQETIAAQITADAKTLEDAAKNAQLLDLLDSAGDAKKLKRHIETAGYGQLAEICSDVLKQVPISRAIVDAVGYSEAAKIFAYTMRNAMSEAEYQGVVDQQQAFHAETSTRIAKATIAQVKPLSEALTGLHEQMLQLEQDMGDNPTPEQQMLMDTLSYDAEQLNDDIQQRLGSAIGQLQASAAMSAALGGKASTLRLSAKAADRILPTEDSPGILAAYGITADDLKVFEGPDGQMLQVNKSGMEKLAAGYNPEDREAYDRAMAIKRGDFDEAGFRPTGFSYYASASFSDAQTLRNDFDTTFGPIEALQAGEIPDNLEDQISDYIGARVANGDNPLEVMQDIRSPEFYMQQGLDPYSEQAISVQNAASELVKRVSGGGNLSDGNIKQAFQAMADDAAAKQRKARQTDDIEALHNQTLDREPATEALHRTLAAMPMARLLFKSNPTAKERKWLREYAITEVLGQELRQTAPRQAPTLSEDIAEEQVDLFGNVISAAEALSSGEDNSPELSQWQEFSKLMGGDKKAYAAVMDQLRGKFNQRFANAYGAISGKPPLIGSDDIQHVDRLLLAKLPESARNEMLEFMRTRDASDKAKAQARMGGKFVVDDEWRDRYEQLKGDNRQINLLTADTGRSTPKTDYQRTTLGAKAEDMLHRFAQEVAPNFDQIDTPVGMIPEVTWDGQHATKQRALKFLEAQKKIGLHFGAGCVHESTMLRCERTGKFQSFGKWWMDGDRPWVKALDESTGEIVVTQADSVFVKGYEEMYQVTLANGSSIIVTAGHRFLSRDGWRRLGDLSIGDKLATASPQNVRGDRVVFDAFLPTQTAFYESIPKGRGFSLRLPMTLSLPRIDAVSVRHSIQALCVGRGESNEVLPPTNSEFAPSIHHADDRRCSHTDTNCLGRYSAGSRRCGVRLQSQSGSAPAFSPSPIDAPAHTQHDSIVGGLLPERGCSHLYRSSSPRSKKRSVPQVAPQPHVKEYQGVLGSCELSRSKPRNDLRSLMLIDSRPNTSDSTYLCQYPGISLSPCASQFDDAEFVASSESCVQFRGELQAPPPLASPFSLAGKVQQPCHNQPCSWASILRIEKVGLHFVFDITVPKYHNYIAHGIINHNSGKSSIMLGMFSHLHSQGKVRRLVAAVPSSIVGQFASEAAVFLQAGKYKYSANLGWDRERRIEAMKDSHDIFITTRESLTNDIMYLVDKHLGVNDDQFRSMPESEQKEAIASALRREGIEPNDVLLAIDEAHDITARKGVAPSKRSLALNHFGGHSAYYVQATGDPLKNDLSEVYSFLHSVAPDKFNDQAKFLAEYSGNRRALQRAVAPYSFAASTKPQTKSGRVLRMNEEQPKIPINEHLSKGRQQVLDDIKVLSNWQSQRREQLKAERGEKYQPTTEDFNTAWESPEVRAALDRLGSEDTWGSMSEEERQQAIGGQIRAIGGLKRTALWRLYHRAPFEQNPKAQWTVDHAVEQVQKTGEAGVVFSSSSQAAEMLVEQMKKRGLKVGYIHGGLSADQKTSERVKFQDKAEYDVLVCTDAAQTGLNLTRGKWLTHYDVPLTDKAYGQRSARIHRLKQDQDTRVFVPMIDAPEERVALARMRRKAQVANPVKAKAEMLDDTGLAARLSA